MTLVSWLHGAQARLRSAGRDAPRLCSVLLAAHVLGLSRTALFAHDARLLTTEEVEQMEALLARRLHGEPLAYILRTREFYGRDFMVTPDTLIPRPETEHLVEAALGYKAEPLRFADLGTGSGCIAVTLAAERPLWRGIAVDCSGQALHVARENARVHNVTERLLFVLADMCQPLFSPGSLDLVVSNPPYVSMPEYADLEPEVLFEPRQALMPVTLNPESFLGMECLERVILLASQALAPGGWLCLEHGWTQAQAVKACLTGTMWDDVRVECDLAGRDRVTIARRSSVLCDVCVSLTPQCCKNTTNSEESIF